jgi:hypothetical protein
VVVKDGVRHRDRTPPAEVVFRDLAFRESTAALGPELDEVSGARLSEVVEDPEILKELGAGSVDEGP